MTHFHLVIPGSPDQPTGGYRYNKRIIEELRSRDVKISVASLGGNFPVPDARARQSAARLVDDLGPDDVMIIDGLALLAFDPRELPQRWIALIHHPLHLETGLAVGAAQTIRQQETALIQDASEVICTSRQTESSLIQMGVDARRIGVIEPGCDLSPVASTRQTAERWLCVASLTPRKNQAGLIRMFCSLLDELPATCVLTLAGDDSRDPGYVRDLRSLIAEREVRDRIRLTGAVDDAELQDLYLNHDLFILPSRYEGYGMVITEAISYGLPVIASGKGAVEDTVTTYGGQFVDLGDLEAWRNVLLAAANKPDVYGQLRANVLTGRERLTGWSERAEHYQNLLEEWQ